MNFLTKVNSKVSALFVFLLALASHAADVDYTELGTAVTSNLSGVGSVLMTVAGVIIGIVVIITAFRFVRRMLG